MYRLWYNSSEHFHAHFIFLFQFPGSKSISYSQLITEFYLHFEDTCGTQHELSSENCSPLYLDLGVGFLQGAWAHWSIVLGDKRENSDFIYLLAGKHFAESGNDSFCRPHRCNNSCKYGKWSWFICLWFLF